MISEGRLIVFFEEQFWVGIFERNDEEGLRAAKVTFGAEPNEAMLYEFVTQRATGLNFSPAVKTCVKEVADNPKRRIKNAKKALSAVGIGTKSQQALKAQRDVMNAERKAQNKINKETLIQQKFEQKQHKKKEKHKGR